MIAFALRWIGAVGILAIVSFRMVVIVAPQVLFDVDPARFAGAFGGVGPDWSLGLDAVLLLCCAAALVGEMAVRRAIDWRLVVLAAIPVPVVLWHGASDLGDLWRGATWCAGAAAMVTVAHLARDRAVRKVLIALLLAILAPLLVRGALQVTIEHQDTIAAYEINREAFLRDKGWEADSPAALIYERRLRQPRPRGWFVTTNLFGSVMAVGMVVWLGLAVSAARRRLSGGWIGVSILAAMAAGAGVGVTGSKGAIGAALAGAVVLAIGVVAVARRAGIGPRLALLPVAMVAATLVAVAVRGTMLPERFGGDLSLLFRWHYVAAAGRMLVEAPAWGVGPDGFQAAYALVRDPRSPEEVASAHSLFFDWLATLGAAAFAWVVLTVWMTWRAGQSRREPVEGAESPSPSLRTALLATALVVGLGVLPGALAEATTLQIDGLAGRYLGAAGFALLAMIALHVLRDSDDELVGWSLAAGVVALLVHAQIEMTLFPPGAVAWGLCVLGVAGARVGVAGRPRGSIAGALGAAGAALLAGWLIVAGAIPAAGQQRLMRRAAETLRPLAEARTWLGPALTAPDRPSRREAAARVETALLDLGLPREEVWSTGFSVDGLQADLPVEGIMKVLETVLEPIEPGQRRKAAALLVEAWERCPTDAAPLEAAASQLALAAYAGPRPERDGRLAEARAIIDRAVDALGGGRSIALAATLHQRAAERSGDDAEWQRAIDLVRRLAEMDPHGIAPWKRLGDTAWAAGRTREAIDAYTIALVNDANFELDPLKQLSEDDRMILRHRVDQSER